MILMLMPCEQDVNPGEWKPVDPEIAKRRRVKVRRAGEAAAPPEPVGAAAPAASNPFAGIALSAPGANPFSGFNLVPPAPVPASVPVGGLPLPCGCPAAD